MSEPDNATCVTCGCQFSPRRAALGYKTCLTCGEASAREVRSHWTIAIAGHKQGYTLITNKEDLKGVNKYAPT